MFYYRQKMQKGGTQNIRKYYIEQIHNIQESGED